MDLINIGKFICELRKKKSLTQSELASMLGVTDKAVSRWETGKGLPEASIMIPLCKELEITVNDLLAGKKISEKLIEEESNNNIVKTLEFSDKLIKNNKKGLFLIILGSLMMITFLLFVGVSGFKFYGVIISIVLLCKGVFIVSKNNKWIYSLLTFFSILCLLLLVDYNNVKNNGKEPLIVGAIITGDTTITYKTLLYDVYRCNRNSKDEYYEIDFSRKKEPCTNPFDPNISDISKLLKYKNKYMGNTSNLINLFWRLPLSKYDMNFEFKSNEFLLIINYNNSTSYINEDNTKEKYVKSSLIYNSLMAFTLIDNLEELTYNFMDYSYSISKSDVLEMYPNYDKLIINNEINVNNFKKYVTFKLNDDDFINNYFDNMFKVDKK